MLNRRQIGLAAGMFTAVALSAGAIIASVGSANADTPLEIAGIVPDFSGTNSYGEIISLSDFEGQTVVLEWTNDGCPFVRKHYAEPVNNMQTLQSDAAGDDVVWITVISSAPGKQGHVDGAGANELTTSRGATPAHVILDETGEIGRLYGAKTTPHMYVIEGDSTLAYMGAIDSKRSTQVNDIEGSENYVTAALEAVAAGEAVATPSTKAYGCSVKY